MEALIKLQRNVKNELKTFMRNYGKDGKDRRTQTYYKARLRNLESHWNDFKKRHQEIVLIATDECITSEKYFTDEVYANVEDFYIEANAKIEADFLRDFQPAETKNTVDEESNVKIVHVHSKQDDVKLPKISLPIFSGDYLSWTTFYDMFKSLVHDNEGLSSVQKLQYLKAHLAGEAKGLLSNTLITSANYEHAWNILTGRYENKRVLIKAQFDVLFNQPAVNQESPKGVKSLLDKTCECLSAIRNLGIAVNTWDPILVYFICQRLPYETLGLWEQSLSSMNELPSWDELKKFLEARFRTLEAINGKRRLSSKEFKPTMQQDKSFRTHQTFHLSTSPSCQLCQESHTIRQCSKYLNFDHQSKLDFVKSKGLCVNCLGTGHLAAKCPSKLKCYVCKKLHHTTLHKNQNSSDYQIERSRPVSQTFVSTCDAGAAASDAKAFMVNQASKPNNILLATALIALSSPYGDTQICRALIDPGSQASFVTEQICQDLRLPREFVNIDVFGLGNSSAEKIKSRAKLQLLSNETERDIIQVEAFIVKKVTNVLPSQHITKTDWKHLDGLQLADPTFHRPGRIDLLLGADIYPLIIADGVKKGPRGTPVGQRTIFGWILSGSTTPLGTQRIPLQSFHINTESSEILKKFWELEELPSKPLLTNEESQCEQHFIDNFSRCSDGRYQVRLPFKDDEVELGSSRNMAIIRMIQMEKRFEQNAYLKNEYINCMKEYLKLNHMKITNTSEMERMKRDKSGNTHYSCSYLPHHAVLKPSSTSTKVRVVFDASRRTSNGKSLNDTLLNGPIIQDTLFAILMRWRRYKVAFMADIQKMYRQIRMHPEDAEYQRIVWRDSPDEGFRDYKLTTVTFGTKSAPYLAIRTMQQLANDEHDKYPIGADAILHEFYVDDLISGADNTKEATIKQSQIRSILENGGLELRKWASNDEAILKAVPAEFREVNIPLSFKSENIKALGIYWNPRTDNLFYSVNIDSELQTWTKRKVLSEIAKLFDPIGWLSPVTITAKILIQTLWLSGLHWDDKIPSDIEEQWKHYRQKLVELRHIEIPRWIKTKGSSTKIDLHGFCDASTKAYSAVVYIRVEQANNEINVKLISSKTKVAPIKTISLPKLELCGANLLAKLISQVQQDLQLNLGKIYAWTDSTIVLAWLRRHPSNWETFIGNRVSNIHTLSEGTSWNHVPTENNPADCASRGISPEMLKNHPLWWNGPQWLQESEERWPRSRDDIKTTLGLRKGTASFHVQASVTEPSILEKFSSLSRLIRVTAYCKRWLLKIRNQSKDRSFLYLTTEELQNATRHWLSFVQGEHFSMEITALKRQREVGKQSRLIKLNPFLDNYGLLRVGGRLQNSSLSFSEKHPIILPQKSHLTSLILHDLHKRTIHGGIQLMLSLLRRHYWVINARNKIRQIIHQCVSCFRQNAQTREQLMANLPEYRVQRARTFSHSGVDYCGPFDLKSSKGKGIRSYKGYIAVFICMVTKAMHLEVVSDLSTPGFLAAFRRFVARRGLCTDIYSDCASNFIGANAVLTRYKFEMVKQLEHEIAEAIENQGVTWHFIPPSSPHFGGLWESGVKSVKTHLRRIIGNSLLTFEEFSTLLAQIEASLNSRPLTEMSQDPQDISALTPGHFLIGGPLLTPPEPALLETNIHHLDRYRYVQRLHQTFWNRWSQEYLHRLQQRPKWLTQHPNLQENQLVLVKEDRIPPSQWLMGRIIKTHPGKDSLIRVVTLKTKHNTIKRPITKLCPLPIQYPD